MAALSAGYCLYDSAAVLARRLQQCVEEVIVEHTDGKVTFSRDESRLKILFPYDCRIRF